MSVEFPRSPEPLIGKSMLEIVSLLPTFPLFTKLELYELSGIQKRTITFNFVRYQLEFHDEPDIFWPITALQGEEIDPSRFSVNLRPGDAVGLISRVFFYPAKGPIYENSAHIPMMDFDVDLKGRPESEVREIVKRNLRQVAQMKSGLILKSSGKLGHFHFLGTAGLLSESQFLTFLGMCGLIRDEDGGRLADRGFIFHALTSLKRTILAVEKRDPADLIYQEMGRLHPQIFATLKIKSGKPGSVEPEVVDIL